MRSWEESLSLIHILLCDKYHVSRYTLRTALDLLNQAEVIYTMPGAGTFIQPAFLTQPLTQFYSFSSTLKKDNITTVSYTHLDVYKRQSITCSNTARK